MRRVLVLACAAVLALAVAATAEAASFNVGGRNPRHGSTKKGTRLVGKLKGGALQVSNLGGGAAFTFMTNGLLGGTITVGKGGNNARPFTTNATGVATGLNADRLDGHDASDFMLAGSATNASTLGGKTAGDFLGVNGKAADSNLLDGLDSTAFLRTTGKAADSDKLDGLDSTAFLGANAKAADSDKLDGHDSTEFLASSTRVSANASPFFNHGEVARAFHFDATTTIFGTCAQSSGVNTVELLVEDTAGDAWFAYSADSPTGARQTVHVPAGLGTTTALSVNDSTDLSPGDLFPFQVVLAKDDGTVYQGVITIGFGIAAHDCFVSGSLST
jgi:hypothetical protein